jgi:hypothetical protein
MFDNEKCGTKPIVYSYVEFDKLKYARRLGMFPFDAK